MKNQNDKWGKAQYAVTAPDGTETTITVNGRERWALECLIEAGVDGCTPIKNPAPRWSHYVWLLRGDGVEIETIHEPHDGPFPGTHARYVLRSKVDPVQAIGEAA